MTFKMHKFVTIAQPGDAKTLCGRTTTIHQTTRDGKVTCRNCQAVERRLEVEKQEWEYQTRFECQGHVSHSGSAGIAFYCDGSCRQHSPFHGIVS